MDDDVQPPRPDPATDPAPSPAIPVRPDPAEPLYLRVGRYGWASLGLAGTAVVIGIVLGRLSLIIIPIVLALFPAALLMPAARWLKARGLPPSAASLLTIIGLLGLLVGTFTGLGLFVANEAPSLRSQLRLGLADLEAAIEDDPLGLGYEFEGFGPLAEEARDNLTSPDAEEGEADAVEESTATEVAAAASTVTEGLAGILLLFVALFFYLKDEGALSNGIIATMPRRWQHHAGELAHRFWHTTGAYFRGQLLVALVDAVFIGIGLALLRIPLAIPLAVLVFFGALFPIVGAFVSGGVAVVVALADGGVTQALLVLALIVVVQQVEGNVLQPVIMSNAIELHPLVIILALTAGSVLLGILGAFLAVPVAAGIARALDYGRTEMGLFNDPPPPERPASV